MADNLTQEQIDRATELNERLQALGITLGKSNKDFAKSIKDLQKNTAGVSKGFKDHKRLLDELDEALEDLVENTENLSEADKARKQTELLTQRAMVASATMRKGIEENIAESVTASTKQMAAGVGSFTKGLLNNSSSVELSKGIIDAGIGVAVTGVKTLGSIAEIFGENLSKSTNPIVSTVGAVVATGGAVAKSSAEVAGQLAKFANDVLSAQADKVFKSFNSISSSGALFTNGMTGMVNAAGDANLTIDQFAGVLKANSETIGASGLGITAGSVKIGAALKTGGDKLKLHMLNLGVSFEDQAAMVAETMKDMRGTTNGPLNATNTEIAEQTMKYAENLKIISAITGEDAKKKEAESRQLATQLAFQQQLSKKSPVEQAGIMRAFENMNKVSQKNFMDMVVFGGVINKDGAIIAAQSGGIRQNVSEAYQLYQEGKLDDKKMRDVNKRTNSQIIEDSLHATGIGLAGAANVGGAAQSVSEKMGSLIQELKGQTAEAITAGESNVALQKDTTDALTTGLTASEEAAQGLKMSIQQELMPAITHYAKFTEAMLTSLQSALDAMGIGPDRAGKNSTVPTTDGPHLNKSLQNSLQSAWDWLNEPLIQNLSLTSANMPTSTGRFANNNPGKAKGGISSGPISGYQETLHGTEAVVPLPDGKSIPVKLDSTALSSALNQQTAILRDLFGAMQQSNTINNKILQNTL